MNELGSIIEKVHAGERLSFEDGAALYRTHDFVTLGRLANHVRERINGHRTYYNVNRHINYTNVCVIDCQLCQGAYARKPGEEGGYTMRLEQVFRFADVAAAPVPSLLRDFSAPVKLQGVPLERLKFLAIHDTDPVARWDSGQQVAIRVLLERVAAQVQGRPMPPLDPDLIAAVRQTLADADRDPAFAAEALSLPSENTLADEMAVVAVDAQEAASRCRKE